MTASLRKTWLDLKGSYWFLPAVMTLLALALSGLTIALDHRGAWRWLWGTGWLASTGVEGARAQLGVIASSMIAIASTVFAITIAAVVYASGSYGPRLLTNFMNDRGNQVSLGVFIATFVYTLMVLRSVEGANEGSAPFVPQLSMLTATLLLLIAVGVLVYFLHHVPSSIRINSVLAGIGRSLLHDIERRYPDACKADRSPGLAAGVPVLARESGYVEIIDFDTLDAVARERGVVISLSIQTGAFVHSGVPLALVDGCSLGEEMESGIRRAFAVGATRTPTQDLEYLIDELVEIALRGLSPGINDPFTAISSLHWLGAALAQLAARDLSSGPDQGDYEVDRVRPIEVGFDHYLRRSFGALRASVAGSPLAARTFIEQLGQIGHRAATAGRRQSLIGEGRFLLAQAEGALHGPALDDVRAAVRDLTSAEQQQPL